MNSPEVATRIADVGTHVRFEGTLPGPVRELAIIITTARELDCAYEWAIHEPLAREEGSLTTRSRSSPLESRRIPFRRSTRSSSATVARCSAKTRSRSRSFGRRDRLGVEGITELTVTFGYYSMLACVLNAFAVDPGNRSSSGDPVSVRVSGVGAQVRTTFSAGGSLRRSIERPALRRDRHRVPSRS